MPCLDNLMFISWMSIAAKTGSGQWRCHRSSLDDDRLARRATHASYCLFILNMPAPGYVCMHPHLRCATSSVTYHTALPFMTRTMEREPSVQPVEVTDVTLSELDNLRRRRQCTSAGDRTPARRARQR